MDELTWQAVLDSSDDMFVLLNHDQTVRWMSRRAAYISGVTGADAVGKPISAIFPDPKLQRAIDRAIATGNPRPTPVVIEPAAIEMEARVVPIIVPQTNTATEARQPKQATGAVDFQGQSGAATAAEEEAESESAIKAIVVALSELELEKRLQTMRREFVANVSHELRSPLTSILGYAETLLDDPPEDEEQRHRFLLSVVREARRMQRLVEDLLNLSQIESGRAAPRFEGVNLHNLVGHVLTQLRDQAERAGVTLTNRLPAALRLECDRGQLEQVVYNLVSNGIQYTPPEGEVSVDGWSDEDSVWLRVTDTGVGIPAADLPRVFERFYRVDKARSRTTGATGLGLSIVKHIVDAHNGQVSVESEPGAGASFTVKLPATQAAPRG